MRSRDVIGKRIVAVNQERFYNAHFGRMDVDVKSFVLEDGSVISFCPYETEADLGLSVTVHKSKNEG